MAKQVRQKRLANQRGMVLVVCLLLVVVLLLLGATAIMTSTTDLNITGNYKTGVQAFYTAEAGIIEAMGRLRGAHSGANYAGDPDADNESWWSAYILTSNSWQTSQDPEYSGSYQNFIPTSSSHTSTAITANSLQSAIPYFVKIRHKREFDAEQEGHTTASAHYFDNDGNTGTHTASSPGRIIYYGYGNSAAPTTALQFTSSAGVTHRPVEVITAYGRVGSSLKRIKAEVAHTPGPVIVSAIYAKGNITGNGSALTINGNDNCGEAAAKPPTYNQSPSTTNPNGTPVMVPNPPGPQQGPLDIDIASHVNNLKNSATVIITEDQTGITYGSSSNSVTCFSNTDQPYNVNGLKMQNIQGFGTLLVEGDLELGGNFNWDGLILCTGVITFNGGGAGINIRGAVLANQTVTINGSLDIRYDSCMIEKALNNQAPQIISWRELY